MALAYVISLPIALLFWASRLPLGALRKWAVASGKSRPTLRNLLKDMMRAWVFSTFRFLKAARKAIAPNNKAWKEVRIPGSLVDQLLSIKMFVLVYLGGLVLVFVLMIPSLSVSLGYMQGPSGAVMRAAIGFNALFIVSIFTVSAVATVSLAALLRSLGVVLFPIDLRECLAAASESACVMIR